MLIKARDVIMIRVVAGSRCKGGARECETLKAAELHRWLLKFNLLRLSHHFSSQTTGIDNNITLVRLRLFDDSSRCTERIVS
jgi:hypothetical protein